MRTSRSRFAATIVVGLLVAACASTATPAPRTAPSPAGPAASPTQITTPPPSGPMVSTSAGVTPTATPDDNAPPTWTATPSMAAEYDYWTATLLADGRVLVIGGSPDPGTQAAAELFDPGTGRWTSTAGMAAAGAGHTATLLPDGNVLVVGGYRGDSETVGSRWLATAGLYDPRSGKWTATGSMATARGDHTATLLPDGRVLVAGGYNGDEGDYRALSAAELYDPSSGKWTATGSMATARAGEAILLRDGRVLVVGGDTGVGSDGGPVASAELYDPSSGKWTTTGSMGTARVAFGTTLLADGKVLVAGGLDTAVYIDQLASAELYDPSSGRWTATGSMAEGRRPTATLLTDGKVLVVGDDSTRSPELYDPRTGQWTATASTLVARSGTATLMLDGRVLVVGGDGSAEIYDPKGGGSTASLSPLPASATLPLGRSAREIEADVLMAAGPDGTLLVSIPTLMGSVLALLDRDGKPRPGWPIAMQDSCSLLLPLEGDSVVVVCDPPGFESPQHVRAFAFGPGGHSRAGWPVQLGSDLSFTGRMIGDELTLAVGLYGPRVSLRLVAPDGTIRRGAEVSQECCYGWTVAPDGIAYGSGWAPEPPYDSHVTAVDRDGERPGWPVEFGGRTSAPAFTPDGRIVVAAGPFPRDSSRVIVLDRAGTGASAASADLPLKVVLPLGGGDTDCGPSGSPRAPIVGDDGTIFVWSEIDETVFALDPSLAVRPGWPFERSRPLQHRSYQDPRAELSCSSLASPAVGPGSTLYLPLQARNQAVGGSLVAVGRDGRVRPGWPVELKKPGAEFWSVVVGSDGTVYALAIEPEGGDRSSATILAIAPDSTVSWTTTIIEP